MRALPKTPGKYFQRKFGLSVAPKRVTARWYPMIEGTTVAGAAGADTIQLGKFRIPKCMTITDIGVQVTTSNASNCQAAIYACDPITGLPTGLPLAYTGNISTASTGGIGGANLNGSTSLKDGFYWAAINQAAGTAVAGAATISMGSSLQGSATLANIVGTAVGTTGFKLTVSQAFGTWPDLSGATFTEANLGGPFLFLKSA